MSVSSDTKSSAVEDSHCELSKFIQAPGTSSTRKIFYLVHKWLGIVVALYILTMSLSGVALVYHDELAEWLNPPVVVAEGETRVPIDSVLSAVERAYPGYKVTGMIASTKNHPTDVFAVSQFGKITCQVDPFDGKVLGLKQENPQLKTLEELHFNLLNGQTGRAINGIGALCLLTLAASGAIVWWRGLKAWTSGLRMGRVSSVRSAAWNWHTVFGAYSIPFLCIWSISGFNFAYPAVFESALNRILPVSSQRQNSSSSSSSPNGDRRAESLIPSNLVATAFEAAPGNNFVVRIAYPDKRRALYRVWLADTSDLKRGKTQVFIEPVAGRVTAVAKPQEEPFGDKLIQWLSRMHFGTIFDKASKPFWIVIGLLPASLALSGIFIFFKPKSKIKPGVAEN